MTKEEVEKLPPRGNGKAVFMPEPTAQEVEEYYDKKSGWNDFYKKAQSAMGVKNNAKS